MMCHRWRGLALAALSLSMASPIQALDFTVLTLPNGPDVLLLAGEIVEGDAIRFASYLNLIERDPDGLKNLALNSSGGSVLEALKMAEVMDGVGVNTIVPPGAACASACAVVLYVAGTYKVVIEGGYLGMHYCFDRQSGRSIPECNEIVAEHALRHGVAYGAVKAFMDYVPPGDMGWMDASMAECWGLTRYPGEPSASAKHAPCVIEAIRNRRR